MRKCKKGFTLIELLVVIAIIAILAAILFPVFAQAREKARQITCVSNVKQFLLGILQYNQDYDEGMPITFKDANSYGSGTVAFNTGAAGDPDYLGQQTGIPQEIQPYIKSENLFSCPDDHPMTASEAASIGNGSAPGGVATNLVGLTYFQVYGTSYKFTNQNYTHPGDGGPSTDAANSAAKADTGYAAIQYCTSVGATKCDYAAHGEAIPAGQSSFTATAADLGPAGMAQSELTLGMFTRPSETRCVGDWVKTWADNPSAYKFHPTGTSIGYLDGHAKFLVSEGNSYQSGCDGVDWAWDNAGSCNIKGLQRQAD